VCLGCGAVSGRRLALGLCAACHRRIAEAESERCRGCGAEIPGAVVPGGYRCGACAAGRRPACERVLALGAYRPPLAQVVVALKFRRLEHLGAPLAGAIATRFAGDLAAAELVVPVPLHWRRRLARGYNQAEAIARPLARALRRPLRLALRRARATPPQSGLDRAARRRSVRGAFALRGGAAAARALRGAHVLLVDDVVTTGATIEAAARTLRRVGAARVTAAVVARTPREAPCGGWGGGALAECDAGPRWF
jgi:ComF family protein